MNIIDGITFQDVLLKPKYSTIKSRSEVDVSVSLCKGFKFKAPYIPANMKDICGKQMHYKMYSLGALSLMHRFNSISDQLEMVKEFSKNPDMFNYIGVSVGVKEEDKKNISEFVKLGIKIICIDIAHLDSIQGHDMIEFIDKNYPEILLIAGNVATGEAAYRAWKVGADVVKIGVGSSGICSTRIETGNGVPQLSALMDVKPWKERAEKELNRKCYTISDGGHKQVSDIVKSLLFTDMVMLGGMFSGASESNGKMVLIDGEEYISYGGSSTHKQDRIEGVRGLVKPKGPIDDIVKIIIEGIQSACSYQNCRNLNELKLNFELIKLSNAAINESQIYGVKVI